MVIKTGSWAGLRPITQRGPTAPSTASVAWLDFMRFPPKPKPKPKPMEYRPNEWHRRPQERLQPLPASKGRTPACLGLGKRTLTDRG